MRITKSDYVTYVTCPKTLWLNKYKKELAITSDSTIKRMSSGNELGDLAMRLFGDYYLAETKDENGILDLNQMHINTINELNNPNTSVICEAAFIKDNLYCAVDILKKTDDGLEIYEVKSSTDVKEYHITDSSFQYYVLNELNYKIKDVYIITVDSSYVRKDELEVKKLLKLNKVTDQVLSQQPFILDNINKIMELYNADEPESILDKHCKNPHECAYMKYCYKDIPTPSVFDLSNFRKSYTLFKEGIITFEDILNSKHYSKLTDGCKTQIKFELENKGTFVDKEKVKEFLDSLTYPLYLLDFETFQPVIPPFKNTKAYSQIPFQYSLHILHKDGHLEHKEFLGIEGTNPTYDLAKSLLNDIPSNSMVMAYNMSFEKSRIKELAEMYPDLKYRLLHRLNNFVDLMIPFQQKHVYKKEFQGSYSIKYILPGLFPNDPELDYHNLDIIHNGSEAMTMYEDLLNYPLEERIKIRTALLKYCELDTYAMYKILKKLYELIN